MTVFVRHPVDNPRITQPFGVKNSWEAQPHMGVDYGAPEGTPIYAPCDGFVVWASFDVFPYGNTWEMIPGSGNSGGCVILQPPAPHTSLQTSFSHMSEILVRPGQWVTAGTMIGRVGNTGFSFGEHLHWEAFIDYAEGVYPPGTYWGRVNPLDYFNTSTVVPLGTGGKGTTNPSEDDELKPDERAALLRAVQILEATDVTLHNTQRGAVASRINRAPSAGQLASQGDINIVLQRMAGLEAALQGIAGKDSADDIQKAIEVAVKKASPATYMKAAGDATVYAHDVASGKLRPVGKAEWDAVGNPLTIVDQKYIEENKEK